MANAFECMDAVKQCTADLHARPMGWEAALQVIELGDMLKGVWTSYLPRHRP
jgi:hypothetical protein